MLILNLPPPGAHTYICTPICTPIRRSLPSTILCTSSPLSHDNQRALCTCVAIPFSPALFGSIGIKRVHVCARTHACACFSGIGRHLLCSTCTYLRYFARKRFASSQSTQTQRSHPSLSPFVTHEHIARRPPSFSQTLFPTLPQNTARLPTERISMLSSHLKHRMH